MFSGWNGFPPQPGVGVPLSGGAFAGDAEACVMLEKQQYATQYFNNLMASNPCASREGAASAASVALQALQQLEATGYFEVRRQQYVAHFSQHMQRPAQPAQQHLQTQAFVAHQMSGILPPSQTPPPPPKEAAPPPPWVSQTSDVSLQSSVAFHGAEKSSASHDAAISSSSNQDNQEERDTGTSRSVASSFSASSSRRSAQRLSILLKPRRQQQEINRAKQAPSNTSLETTGASSSSPASSLKAAFRDLAVARGVVETNISKSRRHAEEEQEKDPFSSVSSGGGAGSETIERDTSVVCSALKGGGSGGDQALVSVSCTANVASLKRRRFDLTSVPSSAGRCSASEQNAARNGVREEVGGAVGCQRSSFSGGAASSSNNKQSQTRLREASSLRGGSGRADDYGEYADWVSRIYKQHSTLCGDASRATMVYEYVAHATQCFSSGLFAGRRFRDEPPPTEEEIRAVLQNKEKHKQELLARIQQNAPSSESRDQLEEASQTSSSLHASELFLPRNSQVVSRVAALSNRRVSWMGGMEEMTNESSNPCESSPASSSVAASGVSPRGGGRGKKGSRQGLLEEGEGQRKAALGQKQRKGDKRMPLKLEENAEERRRRLERLHRFGGTPATQSEASSLHSPAPLSWEAKLKLARSTERIVGTNTNIEKQYLRLTNAPDPATVRPESVLRQALAHLLSVAEAGESTSSGGRGWAYLDEQFRSLRQDLTVQHICNDFTREVYEQNARLALKHRDLGQFNQCQAQLRHLYVCLDVPLQNPGRIEFLCYRVVYMALQGMRLDLLRLFSASESRAETSHCDRR